jgi:prolyl-tRNA synthetase
VLQKVSQIVRQEMDATGAQECLLPQLQPAELWRESGRWDVYKAEGIAFTLSDRADRELMLGPTHEEVITTVAKELIRSYRQLPVNLYQIQTKFRDEIRPRFGLLRGREFIMKDAYSFHTSPESLKETYDAMDQAYRNMLRRCGLKFRPVQADSGAIGGSASQEFMILAETGEDEILFTEDEQYAANVEKAVSLPVDAVPSPFTSFETLETPDTNTIARLCEVLKCDPTQVVKNVLYEAVLDNGKRVLVLISIRGDRDVNEVKLFNAITQRAPNYGGSKVLALKVPDAAAQAAWAAKPLPLGYIAPDLSDDHIATAKDTAPQFLRLVDPNASQLQNFVTGANQAGYHVVGANWGTQYKLPEVVELDVARPGDRAVHDPSQILQSARGIEAGHIFQLGLKYSQAMGAAFTTESGESQPFWMGCYGVGVSRIAQAAVEQSHDKNGIIWPVAIAPYQAIVTVPNIADENQMAIAQQLYSDLNAAGIETILDDREERAGVKFKDADLIGIPFRVVTGRAIAQGKVELVTRATGTAEEVAIAELVSTLQTKIAEAL